jgi:hypothetical protein
VSQLHLVRLDHVQTNDKINGIQVDDLNRHHNFTITTNRHCDLDRAYRKLRSVITVLYRDTLVRRFETQLVYKERFTTKGRGVSMGKDMRVLLNIRLLFDCVATGTFRNKCHDPFRVTTISYNNLRGPSHDSRTPRHVNLSICINSLKDDEGHDDNHYLFDVQKNCSECVIQGIPEEETLVLVPDENDAFSYRQLFMQLVEMKNQVETTHHGSEFLPTVQTHYPMMGSLRLSTRNGENLCQTFGVQTHRAYYESLF